jgi:hypothetical protein
MVILWNNYMTKSIRKGAAVLAGQVIYAHTGSLPELITVYHLLGDPALRLK